MGIYKMLFIVVFVLLIAIIIIDASDPEKFLGFSPSGPELVKLLAIVGVLGLLITLDVRRAGGKS